LKNAPLLHRIHPAFTCCFSIKDHQTRHILIFNTTIGAKSVSIPITTSQDNNMGTRILVKTPNSYRCAEGNSYPLEKFSVTDIDDIQAVLKTSLPKGDYNIEITFVAYEVTVKSEDTLVEILIYGTNNKVEQFFYNLPKVHPSPSVAIDNNFNVAVVSFSSWSRTCCCSCCVRSFQSLSSKTVRMHVSYFQKVNHFIIYK